jgi:CheY-like chemotaxis protein
MVLDSGKNLNDIARGIPKAGAAPVEYSGEGCQLGVQVVQNLISRLKGTIHFRENEPRGVCATVRLPCALAQEAELEAISSHPRASGSEGQEGVSGVAPLVASDMKKVTVLLAEDNLMNRKLLGRMLESSFRRVISCEDGVQAVEAFSAEQGQIDLVILDIQMPNMGGIETAHRIRGQKRDIPIIFLTGEVVEDIHSAVAKLAPAHFMSKPVSKKLLLQTIATLLSQFPMPAEPEYPSADEYIGVQGRPCWRDGVHYGAPKWSDEDARMKVLRDCNVLDSSSTQQFDRLVHMARLFFHVPIAIITLIDTDRQILFSKEGINAQETARDVAFCPYAIRQASPDVLVVEDALLDRRFMFSPVVTGFPYIRFYAGAAMVVKGHKLGTVCIVDTVARLDFGSEQSELLKCMADMAAELLTARIEKKHARSSNTN